MDSSKRAFLGMPGYGPIAPTAAASFWRCTSTPEHVMRAYREGSLLAATFNMLWCDALNHKLIDGHQLDYFSMLHSDIGAEDNWLDTLIEEMESRELDVLGVVVPIKDPRGLTSIALERPDQDPWRIQCRLSMAEVFSLPETFTAEDTGYNLLLNTGLWVCRFGERITKLGLSFTINDDIIFDNKLKRFIPRCEPEDWNFSRQLNRAGLRLGATRKIRTIHRGHWEVGNGEPWGTDLFDKEWSPGGSVIPNGFKFPADIEGWLTYEEGKALFDAAKGKRVLEIGSYCGRSTVCLAQSAKSVDAVDTHDGRGTACPRNTFWIFGHNCERYGVASKVHSHVCTTSDFATKPRFGEHDFPFDLIFIDGAHDYKSVTNDILQTLPLLADDGLFVFHDYHSPDDPDVTKAVDELIAAGGKILSTHGSVAVVRPPAAVTLEA